MTERSRTSRIFRKLAIVIPVVMIAILIAGCSRGFTSEGKEAVPAAPSPVSSFPNPTNGMVQSHEGGSVTINVEWQGAEDHSLVFYVALNTHSVDLDNYDLRELAVLRDNGGEEYSPTSWESASGGHHRQGVLHFPLPDSLVQGEAEYLEIMIRDVAGIEARVMKWEL